MQEEQFDDMTAALLAAAIIDTIRLNSLVAKPARRTRQRKAAEPGPQAVPSDPKVPRGR